MARCTGSGSSSRTHAAQLCASVALVLAFGAMTATAQQSRRPNAVPLSDKPAYPGSRYHGAIDGNGNVIPCRCRFQERDYRLGEVVCMSTHLGMVLTRCDLNENNTSWVPSETPCVSSRGRGEPVDVARR